MKIFIFLTAAVLFAGPAPAAEPAKSIPEQQQVVKEEPAKAPAPASEVPKTPEVLTPPAAAGAAEKTEPARPRPCPGCFLPLQAGYKNIMDELNSWTTEMEAQAADCDQTLSTIQRQIDEKDRALEQAKLGNDKKAVKAAVKSLTKERKLLLKEYSAANGKKTSFYKQFSKEIAKRADGYNKMVTEKLKEARAAASQQ